MWFLGIVIGFILGALVLSGIGGGITGALVGFIVAWALRAQARMKAMQVSAAVTPARAVDPMTDISSVAALHSRLGRIEERLLQIEAQLGGGDVHRPASFNMPQPLPDAAQVPPPHVPPSQVPPPQIPPDAPAEVASIAMQGDWTRSAGGTVQAAPAVHAARIASQPSTSTPPMLRVPRVPNPLWAWFTGGNALTRIGVVVLFFGVGFLLKHFAWDFTVPIELRLAGVGLLGAALIAIGIRLQRGRPGYGLSLQGAGAGILYLTVFAAFRFYDVLPATAALTLLALVAVLTVGLALRNDSQPLAGLAIAGGFLAPFLVDAQNGGPALLFGYFALLNGAIFAVAWRRTWRALNVLGFVFTFVLGLVWGHQYYAPSHFATVQPFLALFFTFYLAIAILYARNAPLAMRAPVDALLVFGVPLVGFALQAALVQDTRYGVAWSALALAALYGALFAVLRRRSGSGWALLSRTFLVLAVLFATLAIPFAADARWTSAWWALEAAAVYWIGCEQRQRLPRAFALLLQLGAAASFIYGGVPEGGPWLLNASFLGTAMIAMAALATSFVADHAGDRISAREQALSPFVFGWGLLWWFGGGIAEVGGHLPRTEQGNPVLLFVTASALVALLLRRRLNWPRLPWFGAALLPAMAVVAGVQWQFAHTTLLAWGWLVWTAAWLAHWLTLRALEKPRDGSIANDRAAQPGTDFLPLAHTLSAIALLAWIAWEASEWVGRTMPRGTTWMACAAAWPAIAYLGLAVRHAESPRWPYARYRDAYATSAGTAAAALLLAWFAIVNVVSPGSPAPLPYLPVVNPLDVTLIAALLALWAWARRFGNFDERTLYGWLGACVFLLVNGVVFRTMHHWGDVPWRWSALLASKPLQAALTLTWTATALPLMVIACRRAIRPLWMAGAALLAIVVVKLFVLDLAALSGLSRVVAFMGVGALLLLIGYLAPLPPASPAERATAAR